MTQRDAYNGRSVRPSAAADVLLDALLLGTTSLAGLR
jgi:hypothetical protein